MLWFNLILGLNFFLCFGAYMEMNDSEFKTKGNKILTIEPPHTRLTVDTSKISFYSSFTDIFIIIALDLFSFYALFLKKNKTYKLKKFVSIIQTLQIGCVYYDF